MNTTLEELSLGCIDDDYSDNRDKNISFADLHHLIYMKKLKLLNLSFDHKKLKEDEIENFRHQLLHITELHIHTPIKTYVYGGPTVLHFSGMDETQPL